MSGNVSQPKANASRAHLELHLGELNREIDRLVIRFRSARVRVEHSIAKGEAWRKKSCRVSHQGHSIAPGAFTLDLYRLVCMVSSR
jgi:hypothetical protein